MNASSRPLKIAAAPISWGVCEVPGWGRQLSPQRVLEDAADLGLTATEAGPAGFLAAEAAAAEAQLAEFGMRLVGAFVPAVLHDARARKRALAHVRERARWLADAGADVLVLAAAYETDGYETAPELDDEAWATLARGIAEVDRIARDRGLMTALHPHFGTVIESAESIDRVMRETAVALCLDTGHAALGGASPAVLAQRYARRIRHVHLKDVDPELAPAVRERRIGYVDAVKRGLYRPLGQGSAEVADVMRTLRERGYAGWYVLEQDVALDEEPDELPWIEESLRFAVANA